MMPVNLIPAPRHAARRAARHQRWWMVGGAGYFAVLALVWLGSFAVTYSHEDPELDAEHFQHQISQSTADRQRLRTQIDHHQAILNANHEVKNRPDWSILLAMIARLRGDDAFLRAVSLASPDGDGQYNVRLTGYARSQTAVSALALRLERSGLFQSVSVVSSRREPYANHVAIAFEMRCALVGMEVTAP